MYRGRLWTMRQYAGMGAPKVNSRYKLLMANGTAGLWVAFDLPTQIGYDSDDPMATGEVGKVGVAISCIEDMAKLFDGLPLDEISTSMTINSTARIFLPLHRRARRTGAGGENYRALFKTIFLRSTSREGPNLSHSAGDAHRHGYVRVGQ